MQPTQRVLERLRVQLERFKHRLTDSGGRIEDLYVSLNETEAVLAGTPLPGRGGTLAARPARLEALADVFGLDEAAREVLMLAAEPGLSPDVARLYTFAWADFSVKMPTASFLAEMASGHGEAFDAHLRALRPDGPLVRERLVELHQSDHWKQRTPLIHRMVSVPDQVLERLRGTTPALDPHGALRISPPAADLPLLMHDGTRARISAAWTAALDGGGPPLYLLGSAGSGRRSLLGRICAGNGRPLWVLDASRIPDGVMADALGDIAREARIERAGVVLRLPSGGASDAMVGALSRVVERAAFPLALTGPRSEQNVRSMISTVEPITVPPLVSARQEALWRRLLGDEARARRLAARLSMPPGAIVDAAAQAGAADPSPDPAADDPCAVYLQGRLDHALDTVAERVTTTLTWDDVVLPDDVRSALEEIRSQARHRAKVFDEWGFRQKMSYGRGLGCLFAGPPGTGKTMMAGIIARDLQRAIYRIDLSRIVSKWIGETEKNLARVFDEAERAQVILFFDEADSLFAKRTEVKGANDRFANMEVNYLLQRMEHFDGISILTTNFERSIDDAFKRRLRFRVHFPLPDGDQRAELWRRMVPDRMAKADDIAWSRLGRQYKFSGGAIKNAVLRAAFYAAEGQGVLTHALLDRAADAERREMGRL